MESKTVLDSMQVNQVKNTRVPKLCKEINCKKPCSLRHIRLTHQTTDVVYTGGVGCLRLRLLNWRLAYHVFFLNVWNGQHSNVYRNIKWSFWKKKKKVGLSIVNWVEWLWNPSDSFVICFCGPESAQRSKEFLSFWLYWPIKTLH